MLALGMTIHGDVSANERARRRAVLAEVCAFAASDDEAGRQCRVERFAMARARDLERMHCHKFTGA